ncbi:hypothetical protein GA0115245_112588 [Streptomyces sp. di188]|nr:hypothetical protein GA0115238_120089 [Streptomyces sp. di50b]SCD75955.1 hypothetical protein GA0115245_112588 [Streptomyces sp. di188]
MAYIRRVYDLAVGYNSSRSANQLVLEFLRHEEYADTTWTQLVGDLDHGFVDHVKAAGVRMIRDVRDPFYGIDLDVAHFGASCNGVLLKGKPSGTSTNRGDVADWGGDWMTFYGEWRRDSDSYSSGLTYCQDWLAKLEDGGTFKLGDLIEDADAYNIGMKLRANAGNIADLVETYSKGTGYLSRLKQFYEGRFGSAANAKAIARDMLTTTEDSLIAWGRTYLIQTTGGVPTLSPSALPDDKLAEFCQGFADMLLTRVGQENSRARMLRAQGKI